MSYKQNQKITNKKLKSSKNKIIAFMLASMFLIGSCQTYHQRTNTLNNGKPCPEGTQADELGMKCDKIVEAVKKTKMEKMRSFFKKLDDVAGTKKGTYSTVSIGGNGEKAEQDEQNSERIKKHSAGYYY